MPGCQAPKAECEGDGEMRKEIKAMFCNEAWTILKPYSSVKIKDLPPSCNAALETMTNWIYYSKPTPDVERTVAEWFSAKPLNWYQVTDSNNNTYHYQANSGQQAKRKPCRETGRIPSDTWTGITSLKAKKIYEKDLPWNQPSQPSQPSYPIPEVFSPTPKETAAAARRLAIASLPKK
jgi:hypothetical protein